MAMTSLEQFIRSYSASQGLKPDIIMHTVLNEGGRQSLVPSGYARQSLIGGGTNQEESYGSFQLNMARGAVGDRALRAGIDPRNPADAFRAAKFAIDVIKKEGLGQWHGWKGDPWAAHGSSPSGETVAVPAGPAGAGAGFDPNSLLFSTSGDLTDPGADRRQDIYSTLADDLSSSVELGSQRRASGRADAYAPVDASGSGGFASVPEFASATPEEPAPPALDSMVSPPANAVSPLAELFKLPDIGMAAATDPKTGLPAIARQRRSMG